MDPIRSITNLFLLTGQRLGQRLLERLALEAPGDQVAVRADQECRVWRPDVVVEHDRVGPAVSEDCLRPGHGVGLEDALDVRGVAAQIESEHREPLIPAEPVVDPLESGKSLEAVDRVAEVEQDDLAAQAGEAQLATVDRLDRERRRQISHLRRLRFLAQYQGQLGGAALREIDAVQLPGDVGAASFPGGDLILVVGHEALAAISAACWMKLEP